MPNTQLPSHSSPPPHGARHQGREEYDSLFTLPQLLPKREGMVASGTGGFPPVQRVSSQESCQKAHSELRIFSWIGGVGDGNRSFLKEVWQGIEKLIWNINGLSAITATRGHRRPRYRESGAGATVTPPSTATQFQGPPCLAYLWIGPNTHLPQWGALVGQTSHRESR